MHNIGRGSSAPLGSTLTEGGANFSVYSRRSRRVELCLFDAVDSPKPERVIELDPRAHRTFPYWHVFVPEVTAGQLYGFRAKINFRCLLKSLAYRDQKRRVVTAEDFQTFLGLANYMNFRYNAL